MMRPLAADQDSHGPGTGFVDALSAFSRQHRAQRWEGTFGEFLTNILPPRPAAFARSSHEYIWDMLRWHGRDAQPEAPENMRARELFKRELFGVDEPLSRVVDYFKAAAAGSDVGRRLLLLLGPPSGGKSTAGDPAEARAGGVQPHRRGRAVCDQAARRCANRRSI